MSGRPPDSREISVEINVEIIVEQLRWRVPGGIGTYCRGLLTGLAALDEDERPGVSAFASRGAGRETKRSASRVGTQGGAHPGATRSGQHTSAADPVAELTGALGVPLRTSVLPSRLLARRWDRAHSLGAFDPRGANLVHATSLALPPRPRPQVPVVAMVHDLAWRRLPEAYPRRGRAWHERALQRVATECAALVVPSDATERDLLDSGLVTDRERVHVVEEGLDHLPAPDHERATELLGRLGVAEAGGYLLAVGTLEPRKNLRRVVEAYDRARTRLAGQWPLVIIGPDGWGDGRPDSGGHVAGVHLGGRVDDAVLSALYAGARCVAYVALHEGFGLPAGEAMAAGAPVVVSRGMPSAGGAGFEVDPLDVEAIADGLERAAADGDERNTAITAGLRRAGELTWAKCASEHVRIWSDVVTSARTETGS